MLSNTYVRIVCANENKRIRELLERLLDEAGKTAVMDEHGICLSLLVEKIEMERQSRRFEKYILPFIQADDSRMAAMEKMADLKKDISFCQTLLVTVLKEAFENGTIDRWIFAPEIHRYSDLNRKLLACEEREMNAPVREAVSDESWFVLAESFIKEDEELFEDKSLNEKEVFGMNFDSSVRRDDSVKFEYRI